MRLSVLLPLFSVSALAQNPAAPVAAPADARQEPASIEGRVVNGLTGEPVRRATLTLRPSGPGAPTAAPPQATGATSDAGGKFRFENLDPGRYFLYAEKTGFVRQQYGARSGQLGSGTLVALASGQKIKDLEFKLTPQAVISGKVVDEDGEPVARVSVAVLRRTAYSRRPTTMMGASTNDVGEFRIGNLAPGAYFLRAEYRRGMFGAAAPPQAPGGQGVEDYVPTFYPGAPDPEAAVPIQLSAGREVSGIEIRLQKALVYRVRGQVVGVAIDGSTQIQVSLQPQQRSSGSFMVFGGGGNVKPDGSFELPSVGPGSYFLTVMRFDGGRPLTVGRAPLNVSNANVDGVIIHAGVALGIAGRIQMEGDENARVTGSVSLQPAEGFSIGVAPARIQNDGAFKLENISRDKYYVTVMGLPEGMYVKRIRAGSSDVLESGIDLSQSDSAPALETLVGSKGAAIEGVVRHDDKPWPGASITLVPELIRPDRLRWSTRTTSSDQYGRFTLKGIPPGEYRLYAWEEYMPVFELEPEQLKPYQERAAKIKVSEGAREQVELKLARSQ